MEHQFVRRKLTTFIAIFTIAFVFVIYNSFTYFIEEMSASTLDQLKQQMEDKQKNIDDLKKKIELYEKNIEIKREESKSLQGQLEILDQQIEKNHTSLIIVNTQVEQIKLDLQVVTLEIDSTQIKIDKLKAQLAELIRVIYRSDQVHYLEVLIANESFGQFFEEIKRIKTVQSDVKAVLDEVVVLKDDLIDKQRNLELKQFDLRKLKAQQEEEQARLSSQQTAKEILLKDTKLSEQKYQDLIYQLKKEQSAIDAEIRSLEQEMRRRLAESGKKQAFTSTGYVWPTPSRFITAHFHDPSYPYRHVFEHPAIDIRAAQGTPIKSVADGYIVRAKDAGMGYSYIMIAHDHDISTVYGHISAIYVKEDDFVKQGEVIGLSGGMPGTRGAGSFTTGPHLHLEFRKNGIPVNPLQFLSRD